MENKNKIINQFTLKVDKDFLIGLNLIKKMGVENLKLEINKDNLQIIQLSDNTISLIKFHKSIIHNKEFENLDTFYFDVNFNLFYTIMKTYKIGTELNFKFDELNSLFINDYKLNINIYDVSDLFNTNNLCIKYIENKNNLNFELNKLQIKSLLDICKITRLKKLKTLKFLTGDFIKMPINYLRIINKDNDKKDFNNYIIEGKTRYSIYDVNFINKYFKEFNKLNTDILIKLNFNFPLVVEVKNIKFILADIEDFN